MQLIDTLLPKDHYPVVAEITLGLWYKGEQQQWRWDHDAINLCVVKGRRRAEFFDAVEARMESHQGVMNMKFNS